MLEKKWKNNAHNKTLNDSINQICRSTNLALYMEHLRKEEMVTKGEQSSRKMNTQSGIANDHHRGNHVFAYDKNKMVKFSSLS